MFLSGADKDKARVGELDEEMVFEARAGETFLLGASTWRIDQITHDRVLVSPAPGEPGKMPFWKGEGPGRPVELGMAIGKLIRELRKAEPAEALATLQRDHGLDATAAANLLNYLDDQYAAAGAIPDDRTIVIERSRDDLGDWRVAVLTPFGSRIHAPWAMAATARIRDEAGIDVEVMWSDDGFVVRYPDGERPPDTSLLLPDPDEVERLVVRQLGSTAMFAARFREAAGRALLLPRRRPGARAPLWQLRKRASDLLAVAARFGSFPIMLETYRECLRDIFDLPALTDIMRRVRSRSLRVVNVESQKPSPFSASLLFGYVANYIYDGDAPLAERRAQALSVDQSQLRDLIGDTELRDLLDESVLDTLEQELQHLPPRFHARSTDAVHDLLLRLGDLSRAEIEARSEAGVAEPAIDELVKTTAGASRCAFAGGEQRFIAVEDAARYRDAIGVPLPPGLPVTLLEPVADPVGDLVRRFGRTHGPFTSKDVSARLGLGVAVVDGALAQAAGQRPRRRRRVPSRRPRPRVVRRRSAAHGAAAIARAAAAGGRAGRSRPRSAASWSAGIRSRGRKRGLDGLLDAIEQLQGVPIAASVLETRDSAGAHQRLLAGDARHAARRRRGDVGRRRAARRSRRPRRAVSHRSPGEAAAAARARRQTQRRADRPRSRDRRAPPSPRRVVLRAAARSGRRRLSAGNGRCDLGSGVEGPAHQRHAARAARLFIAAGAHAAIRAAGDVPIAPPDPAVGRRALDASCRRRPRRRRRGRRRWRTSCSRGTAS